MKYMAILAAVLFISPCVGAADIPVCQPIVGATLDPAAFVQWVDKEETPMAEEAAKDGPYSVMWTSQEKPHWRGVTFGQGRAVGIRHLRIGFTAPITVGSVLVRGGGSLSVLKPEAAYPGNLSDDSQWMAAGRLLDGRLSRKPVGREDYALWVLPAETCTQALRFSHLPSPGDPEMAGWLGEDGTKRGGQHWVGGTWTGAPTLAVDLGADAVSDHLCYVGSIWEGELRLTAKTRALEDEPVFKERLGDDPKDARVEASSVLQGFDGGDKTHVLGGIAARDGLLVCSLVRQNELRVVDVKAGKIIHRIGLPNPRGVAFDAEGRLLALSGTELVRFATFSSNPETLIADGLDDPRHVAVDARGNFFITDRGNSHQVKVFSSAGKPIGSIGKPGPPIVGPYDPLHLNNPNGIALDTQGRVWGAECDDYPRRVSVWTAEGDLVRAFYGPTEYGGGGVLDPQDRARFFYKGMEFSLDWKTGTDTLTRVFHRPDPLLAAHYGPYSPDTPLYPAAQRGRRYFTSCYTHTPTHGDDVAFIWLDGGKQVRPVAALGSAHAWSVLREPEFCRYWPEGTKPEDAHPRPDEKAAFSWTDANRDGYPQPGEVQFVKASCRGVIVMNDLSIVVSRFDAENTQFPANFDNEGMPHYALATPEDLGAAGGDPPSTGGNQSLTEPGGWTINTNACKPFSPYGLGGKYRGEPRWSYPSAWPGLHASHEAAVPDRPGMVVGHTRLLGGWVHGKAGPMFCINGNMGNMYLFTADGLFVSTLFHDIRLRPNWAAPIAIRNMDVTDVSLHDENFWPSITQTADGQVFLVDGGRTSLVRVDGLETLTRLPEQSITVTADDLQQARDWFSRAEMQRQQKRGSDIVSVPLRQRAPQVDGRLDDWPASTDWVFIDRRGTKANFNSDSRPYEVSAAVALTDTDLYAAWRTTEKDLLNNTGETPNAPFKHGGCLDLMLATDEQGTFEIGIPLSRHHGRCPQRSPTYTEVVGQVADCG